MALREASLLSEDLPDLLHGQQLGGHRFPFRGRAGQSRPSAEGLGERPRAPRVHQDRNESGCDRYGNFNEQTFYQAGRRARIPTLWLYVENDHYYTPTSIRTYHEAFVQAGGDAAFHLFPVLGGDGHGLANQLDLWPGPVEKFTGRLGLVTAREPK